MSEPTLEASPIRPSASPDRAGAGPSQTIRVLLREHPVVGVGVALVAFSVLLVAWARTRPGYDPYGWLTWGYQTIHWSLNTNGAPSWKPLPWFFTVPYAIFGHYAMWLWMVTAVAISLSGVVFAGRIAYRLVGTSPERRWAAFAAAGFAGAALLGIRDYSHYILSAQSDAPIVAICLGAIDCHLSRRPRLAFVLLVLASLGRPEAWPFLGLYGLWAARRIPSMRVLVAGGFLAIPLLWFGIPALTAKSAFVGQDIALHGGNKSHYLQGNRATGLIDRFLDLHEWPLQLAALLPVALAIHRRDRVLLVVAASAVVWVGVEVGFALHGWSAIPRYVFEPAAVVVVLAGVAVGQVLLGLPRLRSGLPRWAGVPVVALLVASLLPAAISRFHDEHRDLNHERHRTTSISRLQGVIAQLGGASRVNYCGQPVTTVGFTSALAFYTKRNVAFTGYRPDAAIKRNYPIVLFSPVGHGWRVRPYHTARPRRAACHRMRARTATS